MRLISWFFIILNFMEYIGSQNASRGRRQRRSKCRLFYAFAPSRRVHLSGRFPLSRLTAAAVLAPTPHAWRGGNSLGSRVSRLPLGGPSLAPHLPGCHSPADPALPCLPRPHNRRLAEKFAPWLRPAQGMCAFLPRLGPEPPAPRHRGRPAGEVPLSHCDRRGRRGRGARSPCVAASRGETSRGPPAALGSRRALPPLGKRRASACAAATLSHARVER